ncbi:MAG: hypothetical protein GX616_11790, partial [Planctomycetes bacterium]|nr:hypothetical protein [Planctomycetota bacterium]
MRHTFTICGWGALLIIFTMPGAICNPDNNGTDNGGGDDNGGNGGNGPTGLVEVPDPLSGDNPVYQLATTGVPAAGASVTDAAFGIAQTRVVQTEGLRHEYSRIDPFNSDNSLILLLHTSAGEWRIYRTDSLPYDQGGNLIRTLDVAEPRWDPSDANLIWGLRDFQIVTINVQTGVETVVKDFTQDSTIAPIL